MSNEKCEGTEAVARFIAQLDDDESFMLSRTIDLMKKAKSHSWAVRRLHEFGDWYRDRRGLEPRRKRAA